MNNIYYFSSLLCIIVLAFAPACKKSSASRQPARHEDIKTMIELDNTVFETEENNNDSQAIKF